MKTANCAQAAVFSRLESADHIDRLVRRRRPEHDSNSKSTLAARVQTEEN